MERYLKGSNWCYYKSNSNTLTLLQSYRPNLDFHLENPELLRKIAYQTKSGTLIRIKILSWLEEGIDLSMDIVGENGRDIFFSETRRIKEKGIEAIAQTIIDWLKVYKKTIPYDGRVLEVWGRKFSIDIGESFGVFKDDELRAIRPVEKKNHPLLHRIIEWKTEELGGGKIVETSPFRSQAEMIKPSIGKLFQPGDWVLLKKRSRNNLVDKKKEEIDKAKIGEEKSKAAKIENIEKSFYPISKEKRKRPSILGSLSLGLTQGYGIDKTSGLNEIKSVSGWQLGFYGKGELLVTKHYQASLEWEQNYGLYSRGGGQTKFDEIGLMRNVFKLKIGRRFLFQNFLSTHTLQMDLFLGHIWQDYDLDFSAEDGHGHHEIRGMVFGLRGEIPFHKDWRGFIGWSFRPFGAYTEDTDIF
ncbi:MAG: hypothetical protein OXB88_03310, partial [Bacteriovoracales bacterium]|nr:hypothetical protein [Bacteriovoracales bacterium]